MCLKQFSKKVLKSNVNPFIVRIVKCLWLCLHAHTFAIYSTVSTVVCTKVTCQKKVMIIACYCSFLFSLLGKEKGISTYNFFFHGYINPDCLEKTLYKVTSGNSQKKPVQFNGLFIFFMAAKNCRNPHTLP